MRRTFEGLISKTLLCVLVFLAISGVGCGTAAKPEAAEEEALSRTEFTDRIENFFEYSPLKVGVQSQFLIHLTDLSDGTPVEKADVTLKIRKQPGGQETEDFYLAFGEDRAWGAGSFYEAGGDCRG